MNKSNLYNYIKLCKKRDLNLILNISHEISKSSLSIKEMSSKFSVNDDEIQTIIEIMKFNSPNQNQLISIYEKYMEFKKNSKPFQMNKENDASVNINNFDPNNSKFASIKEDITKNIPQKINEYIKYLENLRDNANLKEIQQLLDISLELDKVFNTQMNDMINQHGGSGIMCGCCDCSKDGYIFTNEEDQKCNKSL